MMKEYMKKSLKYFIMALVVAAGTSCTEDIILPDQDLENGSIMLDVSSKPHTKSLTDEDLASKGPEAYVTHIDLYIFGEQTEASENVYYERFTYSSPAQPDVKALGAKKSQFKSGQGYDVYVIANSTASAADLAAVATAADLEALVQTDEYVYFTGLDQENVPETFLMDAKLASVVLNPTGKETEDTEIDVALTRAAAKVVVELYEGESVEFQSPDNAHVYHFRNLPYSTAVLSGVAHTPAIRSTVGHQVNGYVKWNKDATGSISTDANGTATVTGEPQVSITGYMYAYDFSAQEMDRHTSLVVNIPLSMGSGSDQTVYPANYYKIPLSNALKFERNKMYRIRAKVNAPGAQTSFDPIELAVLGYDVIDWATYGPDINVGGNDNKPKYLQLNLDHVDMYNVNTDENSLTFASSSYISSITLKEAYYFNSRDVRVNLSTSTATGDQAAYASIKAVAQANVLNGGITITSPFVADSKAGITDSHKNAIRYLTFEVRNQDNLTATFTVAQYPTLYITNEHGYYSYRSDFDIRAGGKNYHEAFWNTGNGGYWTYQSNGGGYYGSSAFFASKTAKANNNGSYSVYYATFDGGQMRQGSSIGTFDNPRMYHVHVTATSPSYIIAKPRLDADGYTESSLDNTKLVSPSFFIASQLGATDIGYGSSSGISIDKAKQHCERYVEVSSENGVETVYSDWRLPTAAEIKIIAAHQNVSAAMEPVLTGSYYYCAYNDNIDQSGENEYCVGPIGTSNSYHVRCVHDAF